MPRANTPCNHLDAIHGTCFAGSATGFLHEAQSLGEWQAKQGHAPAILLVAHLAGDEDIPEVPC